MKHLLMPLATAALLAAATTAGAASYKEVTVSDGGSIVGAVSAGDHQAETKVFTISKDPEICGTGTREVNFVRVNGGMLEDAVVFLAKVKEGKPFPEDVGDMTLHQHGCAFAPALGIMRNKGKLTIINDDGTLHNIHTYEQIGRARRTVINISQPNQGDTATKPIKLRKGDGMKIECDAHDFMHGFIFVAKNPYFAAVDENGHYEIGDIPPGKYKVMVWHGFLGEIEVGKVEVAAGETVTLDATY